MLNLKSTRLLSIVKYSTFVALSMESYASLDGRQGSGTFCFCGAMSGDKRVKLGVGDECGLVLVVIPMGINVNVVEGLP